MFGFKKKTNFYLRGADYRIPVEVRTWIDGVEARALQSTLDTTRDWIEIDRLKKILAEIAAMETPSANATVRRMAALART